MEHPSEKLRPRHAAPGCLGRDLVGLRIDRPRGLRRGGRRWRSLDREDILPLRWRRKESSQTTVICEDPMVAGLMRVGERDQGGQPPQQVEGIEDEVGGSSLVRPGTAQAVDNLAVGAQGEAFLGERCAQSVAQEPLQGLAVPRRNGLVQAASTGRRSGSKEDLQEAGFAFLCRRRTPGSAQSFLNPMGRLFGSGGFMSSRMASNTTRNCASYFFSNASSFRASST